MFLTALRAPATTQTRDSVPDLSGVLPLMGANPNGYDLSALALPAFWRGVRLKTDLISTLPLVAREAGQVLDVQPQILTQPDPTEDMTVTLTRLVASLILRGNAFALLGDFDDYGYPRVIKALPVDLVGYQLHRDGTYTYTVLGEPVADHEIMHIRGFVLPGEPFGIGCVELHRRAIDTGNRIEDFTGSYFNDNGLPSAVIKVLGDEPSQAEMDQIKARWIAMQRGSRSPVVLNKDVEFTPIAISNEDSQFIQTKVQSLTDIANIVGVPGNFVGAETTSMTYVNAEAQSLDLAKIYLRQELVAVERAFSALMPQGITAKFDLDDLLRADTKTRYETHALGLNSGIIQRQEIRAMEGMPPLPPEHDMESLDPNSLNAIVNMIRAGFDSEDVLRAFHMPPIKFTPPETGTDTRPVKLKPDLPSEND